MKVAIYVRGNTGQVKKYGELLESKVKSFGWKIVGVYVDTDANGTNEGRVGLKQMMRDAEKRMFDAVVLTGIERLSRHTEYLKSINFLFDKYNISVIELGSGKIEQR